MRSERVPKVRALHVVGLRSGKTCVTDETIFCKSQKRFHPAQ
jgi:hypothetical protein